MSNGAIYRFGEFVLDAGERQLLRAGRPVKLNSRYFDALALLVREQGRLVDKDRLFEEVWRGIAVGDEALTQCMRTLRRCLDDDAGSPRYIETVPKHGYRFIAAVDRVGAYETALPAAPSVASRPGRVIGVTLAGTLGGGAAGALGGLFYGSLIAFGPASPDIGAATVFLFVAALNVMVGTLGGLGVSLGMASAAALGRGPLWRVAGAALGGLIVGGLSSIIGLDAFHLLLGQAPNRITGAVEGAALAGAVGLGAVLGGPSLLGWRRVAVVALTGGAAGMGIVILGGELMSGSLDGLAWAITNTALPLERISPFFADVRFGGWTEILLSGLEGLLFGAGVVRAIEVAAPGRGLPAS